MKSALIPALALSFLVTAETARAGDPNYDPDCHDLLAAYDKTRNTSRYQEVIYVQRPGKPPERHSEERWDGINRYWKVAGGAWTRQYRDMLQSMVNNVPRFYGCRRQADEDVGGTAAITITGVGATNRISRSQRPGYPSKTVSSSKWSRPSTLCVIMVLNRAIPQPNILPMIEIKSRQCEGSPAARSEFVYSRGGVPS